MWFKKLGLSWSFLITKCSTEWTKRHIFYFFMNSPISVKFWQNNDGCSLLPIMNTKMLVARFRMSVQSETVSQKIHWLSRLSQKLFIPFSYNSGTGYILISVSIGFSYFCKHFVSPFIWKLKKLRKIITYWNYLPNYLPSTQGHTKPRFRNAHLLKILKAETSDIFVFRWHIQWLTVSADFCVVLHPVQNKTINVTFI